MYADRANGEPQITGERGRWVTNKKGSGVGTVVFVAVGGEIEKVEGHRASDN
jgi:hypothetical protein